MKDLQGGAAPLSGVKRFPAQETEIVPEGTRIDNYETDPPTSGPHYGVKAAPEFYTTPVTPGYLVQNLALGHVVVYYNPQRASDEVQEQLRELVREYRNDQHAVVVVPLQSDDNILVLTAWRHMLRLDDYDPAQFRTFIDQYGGRAPADTALQPTAH